MGAASTLEKIAMGLIAVGMAYTLFAPGRQTANVANAVIGGFNQSLKTAEGR